MSTRREALVPVSGRVSARDTARLAWAVIDGHSAAVGHLIALTGSAAAVFLTEGTETHLLCCWGGGRGGGTGWLVSHLYLRTWPSPIYPDLTGGGVSSAEHCSDAGQVV